MIQTLGVIGMILIAIGVASIQDTLKKSQMTDEQKGQINGIVSLFVIVSMLALSYVVFIK